jgi:hypothetical protein
MMKMKIFIRSFILSANRDALHLAYDYHYFWQGEENHHIYRGFMAKIWSRGRVPDHDSAKLLNEIQSLGIPLKMYRSTMSAHSHTTYKPFFKVCGKSLPYWWKIKKPRASNPA